MVGRMADGLAADTPHEGPPGRTVGPRGFWPTAGLESIAPSRSKFCPDAVIHLSMQCWVQMSDPSWDPTREPISDPILGPILHPNCDPISWARGFDCMIQFSFQFSDKFSLLKSISNPKIGSNWKIGSYPKVKNRKQIGWPKIFPIFDVGYNTYS